MTYINLFDDSSRVKKIFFIGIGGISMSSLALISKECGYSVSGSDRMQTKLTEKVFSNGIKVYYGHNADNINGSDAVVYTAAIGEDNPELMRAREIGLPLIKRSEFLGHIISNYQNKIGISGMHGKSTTTSMISHIFLSLATDPTIIGGAEMPDVGGAYRIGGKKYIIFEADEYKASFHSFPTDIAICLNADLDHVDYYPDVESVIKSFAKYIHASPCAVINMSDANLMRSCEGYKGKLVTFSIEDIHADYFAGNIVVSSGHTEYDLYKNGKFISRVKINVAGKHNALNCVAAIAAADICGLDIIKAAECMERFAGTRRRGEYIGEKNGVLVYDDYAHHPSEIRASLEAFKAMDKKIFCIYQPHTYSRTAILFDEFSKAFGNADKVIFADIFAAREQNTYGVSSGSLSDKVEGSLYFDSFEKIAEYVMSEAKSGDIVITMGAGDVYKIGGMILQQI